MRVLGPEGLSPDEFEAREQHRLRGDELMDAHGAGYSLVVDYGEQAKKFDTVVSHVGKSISGVHVMTLAAVEPSTQLEFYLTLKARDGIVSARSLDDPWLQAFGEEPKSAHLFREEPIDVEEFGVFTKEDEQHFRQLLADQDATAKTGLSTRRQLLRSILLGAVGMF